MNQAITFIAEGTIGRNCFVSAGSSTRGVVQSSGATNIILGVLNSSRDAVVNEQVSISVGSGEVVDVTAGGVVAVGAYLTSNASGRAIATTTAGQVVRAIALEPATANGDIIRVLLTYFHHKA